jgi:hypothetical protein
LNGVERKVEDSGGMKRRVGREISRGSLRKQIPRVPSTSNFLSKKINLILSAHRLPIKMKTREKLSI